MTKPIKIALAAAAEIAIAVFAFQFCWLIKWPPNGPIRIFTPGIALLVFAFASAVLWILIGIVYFATRHETSVELNLRKPT